MKIHLLYRDKKTISIRLERYRVKEREGIRHTGQEMGSRRKNLGDSVYISAVESLLDVYRSCKFEYDELLNKELPYIRE
ncbi:hypothetical protein ACYCSE_01280 [Paenibacillus sp. SEL1]|uniref:hypothetical protein n=1 Tax=Paenibacillus polymyxa TaxID=1406 RepID=UPI002AB58D43|nr:hypothetical protein [Paenibacillus polymyxa]MDY7993088.1 hypothetical protein [Paenibacillus polymyxa]MDY8119723.1 hypothetical protein [Paenibacillus polymyxa]